MLKLGRDTNGNKTCIYSPGRGVRGFSVQTNGNMPETHKLTTVAGNTNLIVQELFKHVRACGTQRQNDLLTR